MSFYAKYHSDCTRYHLKMFHFLTATTDCYNDENPSFDLPGRSEKVALQCVGEWTPVLFTNGRSEFDRPYSDYTRGFGSIQKRSYWLGNEITAYLTSSRSYNLRVDLWYSDGTFRYVEFKRVWLLDATRGFQIQLRQFLGGTTGDEGLVSGATFHAKDLDNSDECASKLGGGWWYGDKTLQDCMWTVWTKLTGKKESAPLGHGMYWGSGDHGTTSTTLLAQAVMRIRPDLSSSSGKS